MEDDYTVQLITDRNDERTDLTDGFHVEFRKRGRRGAGQHVVNGNSKYSAPKKFYYILTLIGVSSIVVFIFLFTGLMKLNKLQAIQEAGRLRTTSGLTLSQNGPLLIEEEQSIQEFQVTERINEAPKLEPTSGFILSQNLSLLLEEEQTRLEQQEFEVTEVVNKTSKTNHTIISPDKNNPVKQPGIPDNKIFGDTNNTTDTRNKNVANKTITNKTIDNRDKTVDNKPISNNNATYYTTSSDSKNSTLDIKPVENKNKIGDDKEGHTKNKPADNKTLPSENDTLDSISIDSRNNTSKSENVEEHINENVTSKIVQSALNGTRSDTSNIDFIERRMKSIDEEFRSRVNCPIAWVDVKSGNTSNFHLRVGHTLHSIFVVRVWHLDAVVPGEGNFQGHNVAIDFADKSVSALRYQALTVPNEYLSWQISFFGRLPPNAIPAGIESKTGDVLFICFTMDKGESFFGWTKKNVTVCHFDSSMKQSKPSLVVVLTAIPQPSKSTDKPISANNTTSPDSNNSTFDSKSVGNNIDIVDEEAAEKIYNENDTSGNISTNSGNVTPKGIVLKTNGTSENRSTGSEISTSNNHPENYRKEKTSFDGLSNKNEAVINLQLPLNETTDIDMIENKMKRIDEEFQHRMNCSFAWVNVTIGKESDIHFKVTHTYMDTYFVIRAKHLDSLVPGEGSSVLPFGSIDYADKFVSKHQYQALTAPRECYKWQRPIIPGQLPPNAIPGGLESKMGNVMFICFALDNGLPYLGWTKENKPDCHYASSMKDSKSTKFLVLTAIPQTLKPADE